MGREKVQFEDPRQGEVSRIDKETGGISLNLSGFHLGLARSRPQNFSKLMIALQNEIVHFFATDERGNRIERSLLDRPTFENDDPGTWRIGNG